MKANMYLFNISFHTSPELEPEVISIIRNQLQPAALAAGIFDDLKITKVMVEMEPGHVCLGFQCISKELSASLDWFERVASPLLHIMSEQHGEKILSFMTPMEIL